MSTTGNGSVSDEPTENFKSLIDLNKDWKPGMDYLPVQIVASFKELHNEIIGQVLTIVDSLGLDPKREKAVKDMVKKSVKSALEEQGRLIDTRRQTIIDLGINPNTKDDIYSPSIQTYWLSPYGTSVPELNAPDVI